MSPVVKAASGLVAIGGFTGAAYGTYDYKTATVEYLIGSGVLPVTFVDEANDKDAQLEALIDSYNFSATKTGRQIEGLKLTGNDEDNKKELFDKCKELRSTSIRFKSDEDLRKLWTQVVYWCSVIKNVEEALRKEGNNLISQEYGDHGWRDLVTSISASNKDGLKTFLEIGNTDPESEQHFSKLKEKCTTAFSVTLGTEYKTNLEKARQYCVFPNR